MTLTIQLSIFSPKPAPYKKVPHPQGKKSLERGRQIKQIHLEILTCGSFNFPTSLTTMTIVFLQLILSLE